MKSIDKAILLTKIQIGLFVFLIIWSIGSIFYSAGAKADEVYFKIGAGYKIEQTEYFYNRDTQSRFNIDFNDPLSARIELGIESGNITYGISHHSNWLTGYPFNDHGEVQKTEFFIDYKFSWGIL